MSEEEYRECRFIYQEMRFYTFEEFVRDAKIIKKMYNQLPNKLFYRWYIYSHKISNERKDTMWEYLNGDTSYVKLTKM